MKFEMVPFVDAVREVSAGNAKIPQSKFEESGPLAVVDQGTSLIAGFTSDVSAAVRAEAPIIVFGDHTRALKFVDFPFAMGADGVKVLQVKDGFHPKFVFRYLVSRNIPSAGYSRHFKFLKEIEVPKPPVEEQCRIAAILDHAASLRAKRCQVLEHIDSLSQATFRDVLARSPSETVALGDLAVLVTKGTTPSSVGLGLAATGIPFLRAQNIQARSVVFGPNDWHLAPHVHQALGRSTIRGGDLLLSIAGTIGRAGIVPSDAPEMNCNQAVAIVRIPDQRLARWTLGWLESSDARQQLQASSVTGTITNLSLAQVRALKIPVPPQASLKTYERRYEESTRVHQLALRAMVREGELFASLETRAFRGVL